MGLPPRRRRAPDATHPGSAPTFYEAEPTDALKDDGGMMARAALAALRARSSAPEAREGEAVAMIARKGFSTGSLRYTERGQNADLPDGTLLYTADALKADAKP